MAPISDAELLLFHYRDGLDPERIAAIAAALQGDAALSQRYALLQQVLAASELDVVPEPSPAFLDRLRSQPYAPPAAAGPYSAALPAPMARRAPRRRLLRRLSAAAAAVLLLAIGFQLGQHAPPGPDPLSARPRLDAGRIYQATLERHLGTTRQALLTAVNASDGGFEQGNARLAEELIENNRLYLAAAEAQGDRRLAGLLRALEPVLIELANPARADDIQLRKGVSDFVERSDLLFQVRAAEAGLRARTTTRT